jgi:hypothetical protein
MIELKNRIDKVKIDNTDIFLEDGEILGHGKITVSDTWHGAYTYAWGAMGSNLSDFICRINEDYFASNLLGPRSIYVFDPKGSVRNIRKFIREELSYDLPWYKFMSAQKELRSELKGLENCDGEGEFVNSCNHLMDGVFCMDLNYDEEKEFKDILRPVFESEPWNFIAQKPSPTYLWLCKLHGKLVKKLKHDKIIKK